MIAYKLYMFSPPDLSPDMTIGDVLRTHAHSARVRVPGGPSGKKKVRQVIGSSRPLVNSGKNKRVDVSIFGLHLR